MTLLSLVNKAQDKLSLPRSTVVATSTDQNVRTLLALADEEGKELGRHHAWQSILTEKTFTSLAQTLQTSAVPTDFDRFINDSMFNRTKHRRCTGPLSVIEWQSQLALSANLLTDSFRFRGNNILITPTPSAGDTYAYEYVSKNWCQSSGAVGQSSWAADLDTGILSEDLMLLGLVWRFRKAKGFDYAEEFATYQIQVEQAVMRDGGKRVVSMAEDIGVYDNKRPPMVPEGSWAL